MLVIGILTQYFLTLKSIMRKNKVKSSGFFERICNCKYLQLQQNLHYVDLKLRILKNS